MFKVLLSRAVKKYGLKGILVKVGDIAVRIIELLEDKDIVRLKHNDWDWDLQDSIHDILNKALNIKEQ